MAFYEKKTLRTGSKLLDLSTPIVMGILNLTEDSFYSKSRIEDENQLLAKSSQMRDEGVKILDLGAMSSRPGSEDLGETTELTRLLPAIALLKKEYPNMVLSVDTYRAEVARQCVLQGADIINDISGGLADPRMMATMADLKAPYILMHSKGLPHAMDMQPEYDNVVQQTFSFLQDQARKFTDAGVDDLILDVGFGFGKTVEQNYQLLDNLRHFTHLGHPLLVGISRKSMIYKPLNINPEQALPATCLLHKHALNQGASILRVHDVREAVSVIDDFIKSQQVYPQTEK